MKTEWEYKVVNWYPYELVVDEHGYEELTFRSLEHNDALVDPLEHFGEAGWELVSVTSHVKKNGVCLERYFLKRVLSEG